MIQEAEQKEDIKEFLEFVESFLIRRSVSINELILVENNIRILLDRIEEFKETAQIKKVE